MKTGIVKFLISRAFEKVPEVPDAYLYMMRSYFQYDEFLRLENTDLCGQEAELKYQKFKNAVLVYRESVNIRESWINERMI